jgi:hypothetical protein
MSTNRQFLVRTGISLPAGTASQSPMTFQPGVNLTALNNGSVEWDGYNLFVNEGNSTNTNSALLGSSIVRRTVAYTDSTMTPMTATYTAAGTTQGTATAVTMDVAFVNSSSATTAPYNGVTLPPPIAGRSTVIINNTANPIYVYPLAPVVLSATSSSSGAIGTTAEKIVTLSSGTTTGLQAGLPVTVTGGTGVFAANTKIVSVISSTQFSVDKVPSTQLSAASVTAGVASSINGLANNAFYAITANSTVRFSAVSSSSWMAESAAQIAASNGGISGAFSKGALIYAADSFGTLGGLNDVAVGQVLLSNGLNTAPTYGQLDLSNPNSTFINYLSASLGGTGTAGTGITSASGVTSYGILNSPSSSVLDILIGNSSSTTQIGGNLLVNGTFTVTGGLTNIITTNANYSDSVLDLNKPGNGFIVSNNSKDSGLKYHNFNNGLAAAGKDIPVASLATNTGTVTLTLAHDGLTLPVQAGSGASALNSWITITSASAAGYNGTYSVSASSSGTVSYVNSTTTALTANNIPVVTIATEIPAGSVSAAAISSTWSTTGSISGTVLTLSSGTGVAAGQYIWYTGLSSPNIGVYIVSGSGTTWTLSNDLGTVSSTTISSYTATVTYAFSTNATNTQPQPLLTVGSQISLAGFTDTNSAFNTTGYPAGASTKVLTATGNGSTSASITFSTPALSIATFNSGRVIFSDRFAFSGWANDSQSFEFYQEGSETSLNSGIFSGMYGTIRGAGLYAVPSTSLPNASSGSGKLSVTTGAAISVPNSTIYDNNGTSGNAAIVRIGQTTINSYSAATYSTASSLYIANAPVATGNATITTPYALLVAAGNTSLGGTLAVTGNLTLTTGNIISPAATFTLPNTSSNTSLNLGAYLTSVNIGGSTNNSVVYLGSTSSVATTNVIQFNSGTPTTPNSSVIAKLDASNAATRVSFFPTVNATGSFNFGTGGVSFNIGTEATGNTTLTLAGAANATIAGTAGVTTANIFSANVATLNLANVATTINLAKSAAAATTLNLGSTSGAGTVYIYGGAVGGTATVSTNVTTGTANIFTSITGTITIGAATGTTAVGVLTTQGNATIGTTSNNTTLTVNANGAAGTATVTSNVTSGIVNLFTGTTGTLNLSGTGAVVTGGNLTVGPITTNSTVTIRGNDTTGIATITSNVTTGTANIFTGVTGTVNIGGIASTMNVGVATGNSTVNIRGNSTTGIATIGTNVTTGTANIFTSVTGTVNIGGAATTVYAGTNAGNSTVYIYGNGTTGIATIGTNVTTGTANIFTGVTGAVTVGGQAVSIGLATANSTLTINGNGITGTAALSTNVTTGTANIFTGVSGSIVIGPSSLTTGNNGVVKLGVTPSQSASGNEVVTAAWVLSNSGSINTTIADMGSTTGSALVIDTIVPTSGAITATIGSITGTGPWTAVITLSGNGVWSTNDIAVGASLTATNGAGTLYGGTPTSVLVTAVTGRTITYQVTGGSTPTAGTITNISAINPNEAGLFLTSTHRSAKYVLQANQIGASSTRSQSSELLVTHDAPFGIFMITTAVSGSATISTTNTNGLYIGMTISILTPAAPATDVIAGSATGVGVITAISAGVSVTIGTTLATLALNTVMQAYVANPTYAASPSLTNGSATFTVSTPTNAGSVLYPGMYITGAGVPANTYITGISGSTATMSANFTGTTGAIAISGTPNIYITEYAVLETNGTIVTYTAAPNATAPYNIQLSANAGTTVSSVAPNPALGAVQKTTIKIEKEMIEYI